MKKTEVNTLELNASKYQQKLKKMGRRAIALSIILLILFCISLGVMWMIAKIQGAPPLSVPQTTILYNADKSLLEEMHHGQKRYWVPIENISPHVIQATISVEDQNFYNHHGFDPKRIAGAAVADLKAMAKVQGASTITQQYARNLFLEHDKTWIRKLREAWYTVRLETNYDKDRILEGYLNTIYYGHGVYGIEAASRYYFNKNASKLTRSEASILAGIPKGPSYYSPFNNLENAKERQKIILAAMQKEGFITQEEEKKAFAAKLSFHEIKEEEKQDIAPYFVDEVKKQVKEKLHLTNERELHGLRIYTTLNPKLQKLAEKKVEKTIDPDSSIQTGFIAMDPKTGAVKALIGGKDYEESPFNRATQAVRQPGSTMKVPLYYAAIEHGLTPSTLFKSEPTVFTFGKGTKETKYKPSNYHDYYANDNITLSQAIALSDNIYAVKTMQYIGADQLVQTSKEMGIKSNIKPVPSLALGTSPVRLSEMVNAYGMIENGGREIEPTFVTKVASYDGKVLYEAPKEHKQVLDEDAAYVTTHLMTGMFDERLNDYTTVTGNSINEKTTHIYGGKSGTTQTDSWMIGFSPSLVAGVWTGYDKDQTMDKVTERSYAKNIWVSFMEEAHKGKTVQAFSPSKGVVGVLVNPDNGKLATKDCPNTRLTYYVKGTEPTEYCDEHMEHTEEKKQEKKEKKEEDGFWKKVLPWA